MTFDQDSSLWAGGSWLPARFFQVLKPSWLGSYGRQADRRGARPEAFRVGTGPNPR